MPQRVLTPEWVEELIYVIRDHRPIIYSDGGLTVYSSHGYHNAPTHKWGTALIQGFQDPIGLLANSIEYAYVRYIDSQLVISTTLPNPDESLLIATIYTDSHKVTQIINHMVELPDMTNLPYLPEVLTLPQYLKGSILFPLEKPRVKYYVIDTKAPFTYNLHSITIKAGAGSASMSILKNNTPVPGTVNLSITTTKTTTIFSTPINIALGDELGISINTISLVSDVSMSIYVYSTSSIVLTDTL